MVFFTLGAYAEFWGMGTLSCLSIDGKGVKAGQNFFFQPTVEKFLPNPLCAP